MFHLMKEIGIASAPGKVILGGEHSVVYGFPALVAAINLRAKVHATLLPDEGIEIIAPDLGIRQIYTYDEAFNVKEISINHATDNIAFAVYQLLEYLMKTGIHDTKRGVSIQVNSEIPISSGLGSSAAVAVASIGAISDLFDQELDKELISKLAFQGEIIAHGTPSGVDNTAAAFGGVMLFEKGNMQWLDQVQELPILICNTKVPRETKRLVSAVRERYKRHENLVGKILDTMGQVVREMMHGFDDKNILGELMEINQGLLASIGVSHETIEKICWIAKSNGALGAKLTGAGGGGCVIILPKDEENAQVIKGKLEKEGYDIFSTSLSIKGLLIGNGE